MRQVGSDINIKVGTNLTTKCPLPNTHGHVPLSNLSAMICDITSILTGSLSPNYFNHHRARVKPQHVDFPNFARHTFRFQNHSCIQMHSALKSGKPGAQSSMLEHNATCLAHYADLNNSTALRYQL